MFLKENENNSETVLIEYSDQEGGSYDCLLFEGNFSSSGHKAIRWSNYGDGNSYNLPTQDLFNSFEN